MEPQHATGEWTPALRLQALALAALFPSIPLLAINTFLTGARSEGATTVSVADGDVLTQLATVELEKLKAYG